MQVAMLVRKFIIEALQSGLFLAAFHFVAISPFEQFAIFALFTIYLRARTTTAFAEIRAQNYLLLRLSRDQDSDLRKIAENMEGVFDGADVLSQFTDVKKDAVSGEYSGEIFGRIISVAAQAWMLAFTVWTVWQSS